MEPKKYITVVATAIGQYGDRLRYPGQEFLVPEGEKLSWWMVEKGKPMPAPLKPFVRTIKDLANQATPDEVVEKDGKSVTINTMSGANRRKVLEEERRLAAKSAESAQGEK